MPKRSVQPKPPENRLVVALAYDRLCTFEFGVAVEIFGLDRPEMGNNWYRFRVGAADAGPMRAMGGIRVSVDGGLSLLERAGTIIVPGWRGESVGMTTTSAKGARLLSFCSGVFVLAATGLLDGKRATTHWRYSERLAKAYPRIGVMADVLYVDEGSLLRGRRPASTSACTSFAATGAPRLPTASPAGWWCRHIATAARHSSSRHRYRRRGKGDGSAKCSTVCAPSPRAIRASPAWPGRLG